MYILYLLASTTVVKPLSSILSLLRSWTAMMTSDSLPTPDGSMSMRSGSYCSITSLSALPKSPTSVQQMQPATISLIFTPDSLRNPVSTPISPNSFSMSTMFLFSYPSDMSFLMSVVLPAPRKPEKISTFAIILPSFLTCIFITRRFGVFFRSLLLYHPMQAPSTSL